MTPAIVPLVIGVVGVPLAGIVGLFVGQMFAAKDRRRLRAKLRVAERTQLGTELFTVRRVARSLAETNSATALVQTYPVSAQLALRKGADRAKDNPLALLGLDVCRAVLTAHHGQSLDDEPHRVTP